MVLSGWLSPVINEALSNLKVDHHVSSTISFLNYTLHGHSLPVSLICLLSATENITTDIPEPPPGDQIFYQTEYELPAVGNHEALRARNPRQTSGNSFSKGKWPHYPHPKSNNKHIFINYITIPRFTQFGSVRFVLILAIPSGPVSYLAMSYFLCCARYGRDMK